MSDHGRGNPEERSGETALHVFPDHDQAVRFTTLADEVSYLFKVYGLSSPLRVRCDDCHVFVSSDLKHHNLAHSLLSFYLEHGGLDVEDRVDRADSEPVSGV